MSDARSRNRTLIAMCFGLFMVMLDATIVNTALPTIQRDLDMSTTELQWINNAYTLVIGALVITGGRAGDLYGRRRFFMIGVGVFAASSAAAGLARDDIWLISARALEGIGAALMIPLSLSTVNAAFPPATRGRAIGIWAGISGLALAIGPVLGGLLTEDVSWRAIFFVNVPVGLGALAMTRWAVEESRDMSASGRLDLPGVLLVTLGLLGIALGAMQGRQWGWGSAATIAAFGAGLGLLGAFVAVERRARSPLLDLSLFRSRTFVGSNIAAFLVSFGMLGALFFMPLYLQNVLGYSPLTSGAAMLPLTGVIVFASPVSGRLADRLGSRLPMTLGFLVMAGAFFLFAGVGSGTGYGSLWPAFVLLGLGIGFVMSPMSTAVMASVPPAQSGAASGTQNMNRQAGGTFGIAALGAVFASLIQTKLPELLQSSHVKLPPQDVLGGSGSNPEAIVAKIKQLPAAQADPILADAKQAFTYALGHTFSVAGIVCIAAALAAFALVRSKAAPNAAGAPALRDVHGAWEHAPAPVEAR